MTPEQTVLVEGPESLASLCLHLRRMSDSQGDQIDADRLSRAADEVERADLPPTLSAAMELPEVKAMKAALQWYATDLSSPGVKSRTVLADLAGCKIALEQAWASNRERAAKITALTDALTELRAMVIGECPSLLNEDSGGNGELSCQINDLLTGEMTMKTAAGKAADALLEHIVYYDLVERRGAEIADAVIAELVEIGGNSDLTPTADKEPKLCNQTLSTSKLKLLTALKRPFWFTPENAAKPFGSPCP